MKNVIKISCIALAVITGSAKAEWSSTVTAASDYTFNGVSQTMNDPALQISLDKGFNNGVYAGSWVSNVDFGDDTNLEWDFYLGQYIELNQALSLDYGIAYYTYHGDDNSSDGNYPEAFAKFGYASELGQTEANFWYSWDYFGTGAGHVITMLAHSYELADNHTIRASIDVSNSLDGDKFAWQGNDSSYHHYRLAYQTSFSGFDIEIAAENTNLDLNTADERIVLAVSKTFSL